VKENPFQQKVQTPEKENGGSEGNWLNKLSLNQLVNEKKNLLLDQGKKDIITNSVSEDCLYYDNSYWNVSNLKEFIDEI
jgi:hypothetical protein